MSFLRINVFETLKNPTKTKLRRDRAVNKL